MKHLKKEKIAKFADGAMNFIEAFFYRLHLPFCPLCKSLLQEVQKDEEFLESIRKACARQKEIEKEISLNGDIIEEIRKKLGNTKSVSK